MPEPELTHSSFTLERSYPKPVDTVFAALAEPEKRRRWYAVSDQHELLDYEIDFRPGGVDRLRYRFTGEAPVKGMIIANEGRFENIVPGECVVTSSSMWVADHCISSALMTMALFAQGDSTRLVLTFQGAFFPGADGPQLRELGWKVLLDKLGRELAA